MKTKKKVAKKAKKVLEGEKKLNKVMEDTKKKNQPKVLKKLRESKKK